MSAAAALPDADARAQALDLSAHVLVMAPAGSGKTGLLVQRLLRALATVEAPEQVVAITFTNKAAAEIRARVAEALHAAQAGEEGADAHARTLLDSARAVLARDAELGWDLLAQPARLSALTIDAFCAQLAAQLPLLSGLGGSLALHEDARPLYLDAITQLFAEIEDASVPAADRAALARLLRLYGNRLDRLIAPLGELLARREAWKRSAFHPDAQDDGGVADAAVLAALIEPALRVFDAALPTEDRTALVELLRDAGTQSELLAWAAELRAWPVAQAASVEVYRRLAALLITGKGELRKAGGVNVKMGFVARQPATQAFKSLLQAHEGDTALAAAAAAVVALPGAQMPEDLAALRADWLRVLWRLSAHLRVSFAQAQGADFGQLAESALEALRPEGGYGDALLSADRRIRHLLVDEMQDTSESQVALIERLTADWAPGDGRSLFLVGDPQQSIYAFRKAEVRLFLHLWASRRVGTLDLRTLSLNANFRSDPAVVGWFNTAFKRIFPDAADELRGAVPFAASQAMRPAAAEDHGVRVAVHADEQAEAEAIAAQAAAHAGGGASVAVLARTRSAMAGVLQALRARGLSPACQDLDPLTDLPEVRDAIALAQALWHPEDRLSWAVLLRAPFVGLSWADLVALSRGRVRMNWPQRIAAPPPELSAEGAQRLARLLAVLDRSAAQPALRAHLADRSESVWRALGGAAACTRAALDDVRQAFACLRAHCHGGGIRDLAELHRELAALYAAPRAGQVQVMTVHKSKGLEFDHVLIAGANRMPRGEDRPPLHVAQIDGRHWLLPRPDETWDEAHPAHAVYDAVHALHGAGRANEAYRLLYVAVTRARRSATLHLTLAPDARDPPQPARGSFAALLWPVIGEDVIAQSAALAMPPASVDVVEDAPLPAPPLAPRLPPDWTEPLDEGLYRPQASRTFKPSEAVLEAQQDPESRRDEGDLYAQLVGTLFHEAMQRVAEDGLDAWADRGASHRASMAAGLRRRGMPEPLVETAVARVLELLARTLDSDAGRWLVAPRAWAAAEYALAGYRDGRWVSAVIDRCFEDEDGVLWVIDYKTAAHPVAPAALEHYVAERSAHYRAQVQTYVDLLAALRPQAQVRGALYFAESDRLVTLD